MTEQTNSFAWPEPKYVASFMGQKLNPARITAAYEQINVELTIGEQFGLIDALLEGTEYTVLIHKGADEKAAFGASDAACTLYPGEGQAAERAAFCSGAAHNAGRPDPKALESAVLDMGFANTPPIDWTDWHWDRIARALAGDRS